MNREQYRQFLLSGTVTFPCTFPQLAMLTLRDAGDMSGGPGGKLLVATQYSSPRVTTRRSVLVSDVRAIFFPRDPRRVCWEDGSWMLGDEIGQHIEYVLAECCHMGIVFVPEHAPSLLEMSSGMTAGESVQYYPPLPRDPSSNHYATSPPSDCLVPRGFMAPCEHAEQVYPEAMGYWAPCEHAEYYYPPMMGSPWIPCESQEIDDPYSQGQMQPPPDGHNP